MCTVDQLPLFWHGLESVRRTQTAARRHIEDFFSQNYPPDRMMYVHIFAPHTIKDISTLDFLGGDISPTYSQRTKGLSVFSIFPLEDAADPGHTRDKFTDFEETHAMHTPADRTAMHNLAQGLNSLPKCRITFSRLVDFLSIIFGMMFSEQCKLVRHLEEIQQILNVPPSYFINHHFREWRTYLWKLHLAIQEFFAAGHSL